MLSLVMLSVDKWANLTESLPVFKFPPQRVFLAYVVIWLLLVIILLWPRVITRSVIYCSLQSVVGVKLILKCQAIRFKKKHHSEYFSLTFYD